MSARRQLPSKNRVEVATLTLSGRMQASSSSRQKSQATMVVLQDEDDDVRRPRKNAYMSNAAAEEVNVEEVFYEELLSDRGCESPEEVQLEEVKNNHAERDPSNRGRESRYVAANSPIQSGEDNHCHVLRSGFPCYMHT
jgi:hypothetical protein